MQSGFPRTSVPAKSSLPQVQTHVLHVFVEHRRETGPGFLERVNPVAAGPPLDAPPAHEECSEKHFASANFQGHGVAAVTLGQLNGIGEAGNYLGSRYAASFGHAGIVSRGRGRAGAGAAKVKEAARAVEIT
jgi:hypothetical protein